MAETIDSEALATLVEHHRRFLRFLESRLGRRAAAAEELLQAAEPADAVVPPPELEGAVCQEVHGLIATLKDEDATGVRRTDDAYIIR